MFQRSTAQMIGRAALCVLPACYVLAVAMAGNGVRRCLEMGAYHGTSITGVHAMTQPGKHSADYCKPKDDGSRSTEAKIEKRHLANLKTHPRQASLFRDVNQSTIEELARHIKERGLDRPIETQPDGTIIFGYLRVGALLHLGITETDVLVRYDLEAEGPEAIEKRLIEDNLDGRHQLDIINRECAVRNFMCKRFGISGKTFDRLQAAFSENKLARTTAPTVACPPSATTMAAPGQKTQELIAEAIRSGQAPKDAVAQQLPKAKNMLKLTQPLKWFGGKHYLAPKIIALMPPHLHYVEPFFGGGTVLLARDPEEQRLWLPGHKGVSEVVNDIDHRLMNFWRVLQDPATFAQFQRIVEAVPLSRPGWQEAHAHAHDGTDPVADAVAFFIDARQSRAANMKGFTSLTRSRTRRGMNGNASEWLGAVEGLQDVHERLRGVVIECLPALEVIQREDTPGTLVYADPPYVHSTRSTTDAYAHEMSEHDHQELLDVLKQCRGKVMLSGYPSQLYDKTLAGWSRHTFDLPNHAAGGTEKGRETEVVWCNF
jgi:DNA adenine methylase